MFTDKVQWGLSCVQSDLKIELHIVSIVISAKVIERIFLRFYKVTVQYYSKTIEHDSRIVNGASNLLPYSVIPVHSSEEGEDSIILRRSMISHGAPMPPKEVLS